jgi:ribosomal protein S18 acetylase RimI-like enzyme
MEFKRLEASKIDKWAIRDINRLLMQLSEKSKRKSKRDLERILTQPETAVFVALDEKIITGMAGIYFRETLMRKTGIIEDVVVDKKYRGKGLGKKLTGMLIEEARKKGSDCVELTSNPKRQEAIAMYESMRFKKRDTNCYRLNLFV